MRSLALNVETKNLFGIENNRIKVSIFFINNQKFFLNINRIILLTIYII